MQLSKFHRRVIPIAAAAALGLAVTPVVAQSGLPGQLVRPAGLASVSVAPAQASGETCDGLPATIVGTAGADTLVGTSGPDVIVGLGGNDTIVPGKGDDVVCAGDGNDSVSDGDGNDRLFGEAGNDQLIGGRDDDVLFGGDGADDLNGGSGADALSGGAGDDTLLGGRNDDYLVGGPGVNTLNGGQNTDVCILGEDGVLIACEIFDALAAVDDVYSTDEDSVLNVAAPGVLGNDVDPFGTASVTPVSGVQSAAGASVDIAADGSFQYDPGSAFDYVALNETAADSFSYSITDVLAQTSDAAVTVTVEGRNDTPSADDVGVETQGSPVTIVLTGSDPDFSDSLTFAIVPGSFNGVGTLGAVDPSSGEVAYTPGAADPEGNDPFATFDFTVTDPHGASATGRVGINEDDGLANPPAVVGVDAKESDQETTTGSTLEIELIAAAPVAPAAGAIDDLVFTIVSPPPGGEGTVSAPVSILPDDHPATPVRSATVTYDPGGFGPTDPSDPPATTSFTFQACDLLTGVICDTAVVDVSVGATAPPAPPVLSNVGAAVLESGSVTFDLALGSASVGPPGPPDPADGRGGPQSFAGPHGFIGPRSPSGGFLAQTPDDTYTDEATFLSTLGLSTTYDFEQPTFGSAGSVPGQIGGVYFDGRIGFAVSLGTSGSQFMRGTEPCCYTGPGSVDFSAMAPDLPNAVGMYVGFDGISGVAPYTYIEVIGANEATLHQEWVATPGGGGAYFGFVSNSTGILGVNLLGVGSSGSTTQVGQQFGIDDLTVGSTGITTDAAVAWNVADSDDDQLGDESNADLPGFPGTPALVSASNVTSGGPGSNGVSRVHMEWDISNLSGTVAAAEVTVYTSHGGAGQDTLDTTFHVASGDGDGVLTNSDWETAATQVANVVLPNQAGITEFSFDVTSQLQAAVDAGFDWFVVQGRVNEVPLATTANRGMQIRSACTTCGGANPPELKVVPATAVQPDLVVDSLTHVPANPTTEDNIAFTAVVKNVGNATAGPSTLSHKIGGESPSNPNALFAVPSLAPGETFSVTRTTSLPAQNYINTAEADFEQDVTESDENNNITTDSYTVTEADEVKPVVGTFAIVSLPLHGTLFTSAGSPITTVPFTLADTKVTYQANAQAPAGIVDSFQFSATNNAQLTAIASANVAIVAEIIGPDACAQVGRPPNCAPT